MWTSRLRRTPDRNLRTRVRLAADRCTGCGECLAVCPMAAITPASDGGLVEVTSWRCGGCRRCEPACPSHAIAVVGPARNRHRVVLDCLHDALALRCPAGWRVAAAEPLPDADPVPDVAVLRAPSPALDWLPVTDPPVALVVEVVSPSTRSRDLGTRRDLYRDSAIPAYWTVDVASGRVTVHWSRSPAWFDSFAGAVFG